MPIGVLLVAGCGGHDASSQAPTSSPSHSPGTASADPTSTASQTLDCSASILGHRPTRTMRVLREAVALQAWPRTRILRPSRDDTPGWPRLYAKTGLVIRSATPATITVHAPGPGRFRIGWGNSSFVPARRVVVPACKATDGKDWLVYPGGYFVDRPVCLTVTVDSGSSAESVRVPVGARCR